MGLWISNRRRGQLVNAMSQNERASSLVSQIAKISNTDREMKLCTALAR